MGGGWRGTVDEPAEEDADPPGVCRSASPSNIIRAVLLLTAFPGLPQAQSRWGGSRAGALGCNEISVSWLTASASPLHDLFFQLSDFPFQHAGHAVFSHIDLRQAYAVFGSYFLRRPLLEYLLIEQEELLGTDEPFDFLQRDIDQVSFPFLLPDRFQFDTFRIWNPFQSGGSRRLIGADLLDLGPARALSELVDDAPTRDLQQPALERAERRISFELTHLFGHREDRFLDDILSFRLRQPGLAGDAINELPIGVKEVLPTGLVLPVLQPLQQALPGGDGIVWMRRHDGVGYYRASFNRNHAVEESFEHG